MIKNSIVMPAAILTASISASAIPAVGSLEVDFREAGWAVNGTQTSKTVDTVTAAAQPAACRGRGCGTLDPVRDGRPGDQRPGRG